MSNPGLAESLELVGLRVSALFGGIEHVRYETQLLDFTDVLVVTSEKLDLLLRNVPELASRLSLVLVDEGHSLDRSQGERGLRLEMLLTRIRHTSPTARIILLSAVLPNGDDLAHWLDPTADGTNHASIHWTPSQLRTGVFYWRGRDIDGQSGTIEYGVYGSSDFFLSRFLSRVLTRHKNLTTMVLNGFAYHHAEVPQAVRHSLERAYRDGTLRVLCATSTTQPPRPLLRPGGSGPGPPTPP